MSIPIIIYIFRFGLCKQRARKYKLTYTLPTHEVHLNMIEMSSLKRKELQEDSFHCNDVNLNNGHVADKINIELIPSKNNSREDFM